MSLTLRYAARSDVGLLREGNEDSAYAGPRLLAVADGMGGHAHGEVASAGAIATLAPLDDDVFAEAELTTALERAVHAANDKLRHMVDTDPSLEGMGTTLTAMLWNGRQAALVHIGDSRGYLLRYGELQRITRDHTLVQSLIDEGRIDEEEAAVHPQRSLLLRALDGRSEVEPDLTAYEAREGDRYLLCSDGLSGVVSEETLSETLRAGWDPERVVQQLIELANRGGGPDNITCVVADVIDTTDEGRPEPVVAGAAATAVERADGTDTVAMDTSAGRAAALMRNPGAEEEEPEQLRQPSARRRSWPKIFLSVLVLALLVGGASYGGLSYARSQYYVGARDGEVVIFRGISEQVAGRNLSRVHKHTGISLSELPTFQRNVVAGNIHADSLTGAQQIVGELRAEARACAPDRSAGSEPTRSPGDSPRDGKTGDGDRKDGRQQDLATGQNTNDRRQGDVQQRSSPAPEEAPEGCPEGVSATSG